MPKSAVSLSTGFHIKSERFVKREGLNDVKPKHFISIIQTVKECETRGQTTITASKHDTAGVNNAVIDSSTTSLMSVTIHVKLNAA